MVQKKKRNSIKKKRKEKNGYILDTRTRKIRKSTKKM
jgi:hypothetical protein